jgi:hypothetical protein
MKSKFFMLMINSLVIISRLLCQTQWAGPDTVTCGEKGVMIGIASNPCEKCCYKWEPSEGLSCTDCKNPIAKPKHKTTYKVEVVYENLSKVEIDEVQVDLVFGEMIFLPKYLTQSSEEIVFASLKKKISSDDIVWEIVGNTLGVEIEDVGDKARLTPGDQYGKLKIKAYKNNDPQCKVEEFIDQNGGVKDVIAEDFKHPERKAKNGETLYIIGHSTGTKITAVPNDNSPFGPNTPNWQDDNSPLSQTPPDGQKEFIPTEPLIGVQLSPLSFPLPPLTITGGNHVEYIAGDEPDFKPSTKVVYLGETSASINVWENIKGYFNLSDAIKKGVNFASVTSDSLPGICPPFKLIDSIKPETAINVKLTTVEKYNSPDWALKTEIEGVGGIKIIAKFFDPRFTKCLSIPFGGTIKSELFVGLQLEFAVGLNLVQDPSSSEPFSASINAKQELCLLGSAKASAISGLLSIEGDLNLKACGSIQQKFYANLSDPKLTYKFVLDPLTADVNFKISDAFNISNTFIPPFNGVQRIIESYESEEITLIDKNNFAKN